jgi:hypothetical protein
MKALAVIILTSTLAVPLLGLHPHSVTPGMSPCTFSRGTSIPASSSLVDQFKCYRSSGRHISIVGSGAFEAGTVSGGVCLVGVAPDRIQVAPCGPFSGDGAMTLPYTAIAYVVDDPKSDPVNIYVAALFGH